VPLEAVFMPSSSEACATQLPQYLEMITCQRLPLHKPQGNPTPEQYVEAVLNTHAKTLTWAANVTLENRSGLSLSAEDAAELPPVTPRSTIVTLTPDATVGVQLETTAEILNTWHPQLAGSLIRQLENACVYISHYTARDAFYEAFGDEASFWMDTLDQALDRRDAAPPEKLQGRARKARNKQQRKLLRAFLKEQELLTPGQLKRRLDSHTLKGLARPLSLEALRDLTEAPGAAEAHRSALKSYLEQLEELRALSAQLAVHDHPVLQEQLRHHDFYENTDFLVDTSGHQGAEYYTPIEEQFNERCEYDGNNSEGARPRWISQVEIGPALLALLDLLDQVYRAATACHEQLQAWPITPVYPTDPAK